MSSPTSKIDNSIALTTRTGRALEECSAKVWTVKTSFDLLLPYGAKVPVWLTFYTDRESGRVFGIEPKTSVDAPPQVQQGRKVGATSSEVSTVYLFEGEEYSLSLKPVSDSTTIA